MQIISKQELESEMVSVSGKRVFTNSIKYSEEFGFIHAHTLEKIRKLTLTQPIVKSHFRESIFINERNREYPYFEMTRKAYMFLVMQMGNASNKESAKFIAEKQWQFIDAFDLMENMLLQKTNSEWIASRGQGKIARKEETDTIKNFVEYAIEQGSQNAKMYYKHFTTYSYKALSLLEHKKPKTRDTLDMMQLNQLMLAEHIVTKVIQKAMDDKIPYKDVYPLAKDALDNFASTLFLTQTKEK